jgi:hypothetical protein
MSFWMFIKGVIRTLLNKSSRLTGPAQLYMNSPLVNPFVANTFLSARAKSSGVRQSEMTNEVALGRNAT